MVNFRVELENHSGMWVICLYSGDKFVKRMAQCYEEDYAYIIVSALRKSTGS